MQKIAVICPSQIALRRFMPALAKMPQLFSYAGVAVAATDEWAGGAPDAALLSQERAKAEVFRQNYGGKVYDSYDELLADDDITAVYLPLPPSLHFTWAKRALDSGKHVLLEKPFTTNLADTRQLIDLAQQKKLALHENYMFVYHSQLDYIRKLLQEQLVGQTRLIRVDFGFPFRGDGDFRYNKALGGGALLDCGGYTLKLASLLLGPDARLLCSTLNGNGGEVDLYGCVTMVNDDGLTAQLSFGMDNAYKCDLTIWGSLGSIFSGRILTAPDGFAPTVTIRKGDSEENITLPADDAFYKSLLAFYQKITDYDAADNDEILRQALLVDAVQKGAVK